MENNLKNKAKFFAQYWGQKNVISPLFKATEPFIIHNLTTSYLKDYVLELTSLSDITNEDAEGVAKIISSTIHDSITKQLVNYYKEDIKRDPEVLSLASFETVDYIRSKGYGVQLMDLTVEKQIEYGWVKLKESTQI